MAWEEHETARQGSIELGAEVREGWAEYPSPGFPLSLGLAGMFLGPSSFVDTMLPSALWVWFLILFPSRLSRSDFTLPFSAVLTKFLLPLAGAELQKDLEAAVGGAAPGDLSVRQIHCSGGVCAGKPLQVQPREQDQHE